MNTMTFKVMMSMLFAGVSFAALVVAIHVTLKKNMNGERMRLVKQATSGRWLLTVMAGLAFLGLCMAVFIVLVCQRHELKPETAVALFSAVLLIIQGVYKDYFRRDSNGKHRDEEPVEPEPDENGDA